MWDQIKMLTQVHTAAIEDGGMFNTHTMPAKLAADFIRRAYG